MMSSFAASLQATFREIGAWLVWLANALHNFNDRELNRADKEVGDVADGRYDWRLPTLENKYDGMTR